MFPSSDLQSSRPQLFDFHGVWMTHYYTDNWENTQKFQAKTNDVFIAGYPKSGNIWLSYILDLLHFGETENEPSLSVAQKVPVLEFSSPVKEGHTLNGVDYINNNRTRSPRLIRTHLPVHFVPESFWEQNCKVVYVSRNAKDNMVSYFHYSRMSTYEPEPGDWSSFFHRYMQGKMVCGSWYDHVNNWWKKKNIYSNLHYIFYEDLVKDTRGEIDKLCSFLGLSRSSEEKDRVTAKVHFSKMKDNPSVNHLTFPAFNITKSTFMRKGKVGDWKTHFTVAQNEEFDVDYKKKMKNSILCFHTE